MVGNMAMGRKNLFLGSLGIAFCLFVFVDCADKFPADRSIPLSNHGSSPSLNLHVSRSHVDIDNGIVKLTLTKPTGLMAGLAYKGVKNILERRNKETQRGYWDIMWSRPDQHKKSRFDTMQATKFRVIEQNKDQIEVSFSSTWRVSHGENLVPLNIDRRFIILRGVSGFYSYSIFEHEEGWPALNIDEARIAFKLDKDMFRYMAISDKRQRIMPTATDRKRGHELSYREAVLLSNSTSNPRLKGEVDDKYQYSSDNKDSHVHGWISNRPHIGFWVITPSDEFRAGGPVKPDLTSHAGPTSLAVFFSDHYAGANYGIRLRDGQPWKKVFGPVFVYVNSDSGNNHTTLWEDAKRKMSEETEKWPYDFPKSKDYPHANDRGTIRGRLLVRDRYIERDRMPAKSAYVGLARPGDVGSWQDDYEGYQFWTRTDETGHFTIRGVRPDTYNLYAWVPGIIGDFKHKNDVIVRKGNEIHIGEIIYGPPRNGPTLWEIGIPDRTASEFFIPDPAPGLMNKLYINNEKFRQYGLWDRYTDLYPNKDLIYTVGESDYRKDWFFAHVTRKINKKNYTGTTWQIQFDVRKVITTASYTLRIALASANFAEIQVRVNNPPTRRPLFSTGRIGKDNAVARHGIHGRYYLYSVSVPGFQLQNGRNIIYLRQSRGLTPFVGVMYDYIRLEGPPDEDYY
ncbi:hypothetical protein ABFS83_08G220400 [Erythranthe nasuta]